MSIRKTFRREMRVAFSRHAQPLWFRVLKWMIVAGFIAFFWRQQYFWLWIVGALGLALTVHFIWRWKTKAWTHPWGGWSDVATAEQERETDRASAHDDHRAGR